MEILKIRDFENGELQKLKMQNLKTGKIKKLKMKELENLTSLTLKKEYKK